LSGLFGFGDLSGFVIVIAQDADDRNFNARFDLAREKLGFLRQAVVRQVTTEQQDVSGLANLREEGTQRSLVRSGKVQVAESSNTHHGAHIAEQDVCRDIQPGGWHTSCEA